MLTEIKNRSVTSPCSRHVFRFHKNNSSQGSKRQTKNGRHQVMSTVKEYSNKNAKHMGENVHNFFFAVH